MFGRGTPVRTQVANAALNAKDHLPSPVMQLAMKVLKPPKK
jgi:acyl-CoA dehydrogenase